jgi:hypothetical protein
VTGRWSLPRLEKKQISWIWIFSIKTQAATRTSLLGRRDSIIQTSHVDRRKDAWPCGNLQAALCMKNRENSSAVYSNVALSRSHQMSCRWASSAVTGPLKIRYFVFVLTKRAREASLHCLFVFPRQQHRNHTIPCRPYLQEHDLSAHQPQKQETDMGDHLLLNPMTLIVWPHDLRLRREAVNLQVGCQ